MRSIYLHSCGFLRKSGVPPQAVVPDSVFAGEDLPSHVHYTLGIFPTVILYN